MANKAYKFRLYPTGEQEQLLAKTFGCVRFVYNKMLTERQSSKTVRQDNPAQPMWSMEISCFWMAISNYRN